MRTFVLRARRGPTAASRVTESIGDPIHFEVVAHSLMNALFYSKHLREDVVFHVALEGASDPPKLITFKSSALGWLGGFHEAAMVAALEKVLAGSVDLGREEVRAVDAGATVSRQSFEKLVRRLSGEGPVYILDRKGRDIRETPPDRDATFLLTDHIPMQPNTRHLLKRLGVKPVSLGPRVLFASQCVTLLHNELDRAEDVDP